MCKVCSCGTVLVEYMYYSQTSLIRVAWDQGVFVTKKMPITKYCI